MVDYDPYGGNYTGTIVRDHVIDAAGAVIRIGLGMGNRVWGCLPPDSTEFTLTGGTVTGNVLRGEHMQYGFAVDGVRDWTVTGNIDEAAHTGSPGVDCGGIYASAPAGFQYNSARAEGTFQPEFTEAHLTWRGHRFTTTGRVAHTSWRQISTPSVSPSSALALSGCAPAAADAPCGGRRRAPAHRGHAASLQRPAAAHHHAASGLLEDNGIGGIWSPGQQLCDAIRDEIVPLGSSAWPAVQ
jgi:hypothetical protein